MTIPFHQVCIYCTVFINDQKVPALCLSKFVLTRTIHITNRQGRIRLRSRSVVVKNLYREYMKYRRVKNLSPIVPIVSPINCQKVQAYGKSLYFLYKVPKISKKMYRPIPPIPRWFFIGVAVRLSKVHNQISGVQGVQGLPLMYAFRYDV